MSGKVYGFLAVFFLLYALVWAAALLDDLIIRLAYSEPVLAIFKRLGAP